MMPLGRFYFDKEVGRHVIREITVAKGSLYECKRKIREFVRTGTEKVAIDVEIDPQKVAALVSNAIRSPNRTASHMNGAIIGRRVDPKASAKKKGKS